MTDMPDTDGMLKISQVAQLLGVHPTTVRRWSNEGLLPSYNLGPRRILRFKREDIDKFVTQQRHNSRQK